MAKTKDKLFDSADSVKPYVDRALHDEDLRENLKEAFDAARHVYAELLGGRGLTATATRVATDKEIQDSLRRAVDELREASRRVQGKEDHGARNTMLLMAGITAGILLNPMTGPQTRKWLMEKITGESSDDYSFSTGSGSLDSSSTNSGSSGSGSAGAASGSAAGSESSDG